MIVIMDAVELIRSTTTAAAAACSYYSTGYRQWGTANLPAVAFSGPNKKRMAAGPVFLGEVGDLRYPPTWLARLPTHAPRLLAPARGREQSRRPARHLPLPLPAPPRPERHCVRHAAARTHVAPPRAPNRLSCPGRGKAPPPGRPAARQQGTPRRPPRRRVRRPWPQPRRTRRKGAAAAPPRPLRARRRGLVPPPPHGPPLRCSFAL